MEPTATRRLTREWAPWPQYSAEEIEAVSDVLRSGRVNQWTGQVIKEFEADYAASLGRRHAIALMNGTVALELALRVLGVGPGDEVVTTPRTFLASASVARALCRALLTDATEVSRSSATSVARAYRRSGAGVTATTAVQTRGLRPASRCVRAMTPQAARRVAPVVVTSSSTITSGVGFAHAKGAKAPAAMKPMMPTLNKPA